MAELFSVQIPAINKHLKNIFEDSELVENSVISILETTVAFLNDFLELSRYPILTDKGRVSALEAKLKAEQEYEEYRVIQDKNYISDFDREINRITGEKNDDNK